MVNRIEFIDIAKGVTILLVIVGHVSTLPSLMKGTIYSFHMPLFFMLSGYFLKINENVKSLAKRMVSTVLLPYVIVAVLIFLVKNVECLYNDSPFDYISLLSICGVCWRFDGMIVSVGAIWFLVVLFWSKIFALVALKQRRRIIYLIGMATLSILISHYFHILFPFGLQQALPCSLFVLFGFICKEKKYFFIKIPARLIFIMLLSLLPFMKCLGVATRANSYRLGFVSIMASCYIVWVLIMAIKSFSETDYKLLKYLKYFFSWCGRMSLIILSVHSVEARFFAYNNPNYFIEIFVRVSCVLILSWLCIKVGIVKKLFNIK